MSETETDDEWTDEELEAIGAQIQETLQATVDETAGLDLDAAVAVLHERLNAIEGVDFELDWVVGVVEGLRRGDDVTIEIG